MYKAYVILFIYLLTSFSALAQWQPQVVNTKAHFRSISVPDPETAWLGGTKGTFVRTVDGGKTWQVGNVPGADSCDFRDVKAFNGQTAYLMSAGLAEQGQARIYQTTDGGQTWTLVYQTKQPGVFFDSMDFWDEQHGIAVSDPIDGRWFIVTTSDGGRTWNPIPATSLPPMQPGEAAFAASGTNLIVKGKQNVWIVSGGGPAGRVFQSADGGKTWAVSTTPIPGGDMMGPVGMQFRDDKVGMVIGGTFKPNTPQPQPNAALTQDGGRTWQAITPAEPFGLKESIAFLPGNRILVAGTSGTSLSADGGRTWQQQDTEHYFSVACAGTTCYVAGPRGRVAKQVFK